MRSFYKIKNNERLFNEGTTMLITAIELKQLIDNNNNELCIFDCRYALPLPTAFQTSANALTKGKQAYLKAHIPNAQFVDIDAELTGEITNSSGRHPLPTHKNFNQKLQAWGLTPNSKIVIYADTGELICCPLMVDALSLGSYQ